MHTPISQNYPLLPKDVDLTRGFVGVFGGLDSWVEKAAYVVMRYIQMRGTGWEPFSDAEIQRYFHRLEPRAGRFTYRRSLVSRGLLNIDEGLITVTHELVARCFLMSPNLIGEAPRERNTSI